MSKKKFSDELVGSNIPLATLDSIEYLGVVDLLRRVTNRYVGEVMQFIESVGLDPKREEAFKAIVKRGLWTSCDDEMSCLEKFECWKASEELRNSGASQSLPPRIP